MRGLPGAGEIEVENPLLVNGNIVERSAIGNKGDPAKNSSGAEEMADAIGSAHFFVARNADSHRGLGVPPKGVAEDLEDDGDRSLHVARSRPYDAAILNLTTIDRFVRVGRVYFGYSSARGQPCFSGAYLAASRSRIRPSLAPEKWAFRRSSKASTALAAKTVRHVFRAAGFS
jgi:hypothetical protein